MGLSLEQITAESDGSLFGVTVVSNEDDGIVSYAYGRLQLIKGRVFPGTSPRPTRDHLETLNGEDLITLFSDRSVPGSKQPFDLDRPEKIAFQLTPPFASGQPATVDLRVATWTSHNFRFSVDSLSDLLVGIGPALSGESPNAVYVFSFSVLPAPR